MRGLTRQMLQTVREYEMLRAGDTVLCAVSGGADSVALLLALLSLRKTLQIDVCACHVNHHLRGEEASRDAAFVRALCEKNDTKCIIIDKYAEEYSKMNRQSIETAARTLRYAALREAAQALHADKIATAHTADDNLETLLFYLARGAGTNGMGGIPPVRDEICRPLLFCTRAQVEDFLSSCGQPYVTDSTNEEQAYTRNLLRARVIPVLREISPCAAQNAAQTAAILRRDERYLTAQAEGWLQERAQTTQAPAGLLLPCAPLLQTDMALTPRILRQALRRLEFPMGECSSALLARVQTLAAKDSPSAALDLPGGFAAERRYDQLFLGQKRNKDSAPPSPVPVYEGFHGKTGWNHTNLTINSAKTGQDFNNTFNTFFVSYDTINHSTFVLRTRRRGDRLRLTARGGHKSLSDLMIDKKIPRYRRDHLAVLADRDGVIAVQDIGVDYDRRARGEGKALLIQFHGGTPE